MWDSGFYFWRAAAGGESFQEWRTIISKVLGHIYGACRRVIWRANVLLGKNEYTLALVYDGNHSPRLLSL